MQTITAVHPSNTHTKEILRAVAERLNLMSGNTYLQIGQVGAIISLVFWLATFKANSEYRDDRHNEEITALKLQNSDLRQEVKELKSSLPSREWLNLKFENLETQLKKTGK